MTTGLFVGDERLTKGLWYLPEVEIPEEEIMLAGETQASDESNSTMFVAAAVFGASLFAAGYLAKRKEASRTDTDAYIRV